MSDPVLVLALLYGAFFAHLGLTVPTLPERVATHFQFNGQADGWMSRFWYLVTVIGMGLAVPLASPLVAMFYVRGPMLRALVWASCLTLGFLFAVHVLTLQANRQTPARLSKAFWGVLLVFCASMAVWVAYLGRSV